MRPLLSVALVAVGAATAPAAHACTIQNCVEARLAHAATVATDPHLLAAECVAVGRAGVTFQVAGWVAAGGQVVPDEVSVRCVLSIGSTVILDSSSSAAGPVAVLAASAVSGPNVRVCVTATGTWRDGYTKVLTDCS